MQVRKRASFGLIVLATAIVSGGTGWVSAKMFDASQHETTEVVTTIEKLHSRPDAFSGTRVRLTGQLNECYHWECSLCPEAMTNNGHGADRCLGLSFRPLVDGTGFGSAEQENLFRFSSLLITATFDPSCLKGGCYDRPSVLKDATVASVIKRRAGASGLWVGKTSKLVPLDGPEASDIIAAARRAGYPENVTIKAFTTAGTEPKLVVCWSSAASGENDPGEWPSTLESALYAQSTLDFFQCNALRKVDGQVVLQTRA